MQKMLHVVLCSLFIHVLFNICAFSSFMNALGVKLNDYREVMSNSQTSTVAERFVNFQAHIFHQQYNQCVLLRMIGQMCLIVTKTVLHT